MMQQRLVEKGQAIAQEKSRRTAKLTPLPGASPRPLLQIQRTVGNHGFLRHYDTIPIQANLIIGSPNDRYEREADRIADQVLRMPELAIQHTSTCGRDHLTNHEKNSSLSLFQTRRLCSHGIPEEVPSVVRQVLNSPGQALDADTRNFMEPRFENDFHQIRVHTGAKAAESAQAIAAVAYTSGHDIVFGAGKLPGRNATTIHELTHVLQQTGKIRSAAAQASSAPSSLIQRECTGNVSEPPNGYNSEGVAYLRCDQANTGIADVTTRITEGRRMAQTMINDALAVLDRMNRGQGLPEARRQFRRLFGLTQDTEPTSDQINYAIGVYTRICSWLTSSIANNGGGILCLTQGTGECRGLELGSAACSGGPINLCPTAIEASDSELGETIIHEAAHHFRICPRAGTPERYELPGESGWVTERYPERTLSSPTRPALRTSADSYSGFAREAHEILFFERERQRPHERRIQPPRPRR